MDEQKIKELEIETYDVIARDIEERLPKKTGSETWKEFRNKIDGLTPEACERSIHIGFQSGLEIGQESATLEAAELIFNIQRPLDNAIAVFLKAYGLPDTHKTKASELKKAFDTLDMTFHRYKANKDIFDEEIEPWKEKYAKSEEVDNQ